jgi:tRNA(fMet)-specific endonuclease VapC
LSERYLLDTNILSDLIRNPAGRVRDRVAEIGEHAVATSIIVAAELRYGAAKKGSQALIERVDQVLARLEVLTFDPPADAVYGALRVDLERRGLPIGAHDMLIAAHALASGRTLVSANEGEFRRVTGLGVENWLT